MRVLRWKTFGRAMKVKGASLRIDPRGAAHIRPIWILYERFEYEHTCWDPKDGELCVRRVKSRETSMEAHTGSDVQIDLATCVKGRKTNRTI